MTTTHTSHKPIILVIGGQWGSEAKGSTAAALCRENKVDYAVRTGSVNAGHTIIHNGQHYVMQQLPCGWVNPTTSLVVGAGAIIDPDILAREVYTITGTPRHEGWAGAIFVDPRAGLHLPHHASRSADAGRHYSIGATGKGCSEALVDRIRLRGSGETLTYGDWCKQMKGGAIGHAIVDTEEMLNRAYDNGYQILIEATQGQMLDMYTGPYPYTTHRPTGPASWLAECGLSPALKYEIAMVVRTYPIRVAGNSGPMPCETTWVKLARDINRRRAQFNLTPIVDGMALDLFEQACNSVRIDLQLSNYDFHTWTADARRAFAQTISEFHKRVFDKLDATTVMELRKLFEFTTVTKKLRRVAALDVDSLKASVRQVRPSYVVLTFLNYVFPELWGARRISSQAMEYVYELEKEVGATVRYVTTGPETTHIIEILGRKHIRAAGGTIEAI